MSCIHHRLRLHRRRRRNWFFSPSVLAAARNRFREDAGGETSKETMKKKKKHRHRFSRIRGRFRKISSRTTRVSRWRTTGDCVADSGPRTNDTAGRTRILSAAILLGSAEPVKPTPTFHYTTPVYSYGPPSIIIRFARPKLAIFSFEYIFICIKTPAEGGCGGLAAELVVGPRGRPRHRLPPPNQHANPSRLTQVAVAALPRGTTRLRVIA